ncbi:C39 family peptidase [Geobacter sp.]|uniref:C39 family peptidase n=1 Tax=Geobacter sp. TaxID=46610 RepID=UPI0027B9A366|nr:C39 family peptidase [Geobacter sp.]
MNRIIFACLLLAITPSLSLAGSVTVPAATGGTLSVKVKSVKELRFRTVIKQQYDFSCGSAALATLLAYHYEDKVSEQDVFKDMFDKGNQEKIRREGFSLLDIKNYLIARGYRADGFRTSLDKLGSIGVPAIVLINHNGYRHFVVVKGMSEREVLLGDPAAGLKRMARADFEPMWNGILFLIRNKKDVAQSTFNRSGEWSTHGKAPLGMAMANSDLARVTFLLPGRNDF